MDSEVWAAAPPTLAKPPPAILKRAATCKVAALLLWVLALVLGVIYWKQQNEAARVRDVTAKVAQVQGALRRGDLAAAERALAALAAAQPGRPDVRELQVELDRRMREQVARREQQRDAIENATQPLGLAEPAVSPVRALRPAETEAPAAAAPVQKCNDALAALALCPAGGER
ncbi:MAG: hypothetical protein WKG52_17170 [Variovorax sp.]